MIPPGFLRFSGRFGQFWTTNWTVLSGAVHNADRFCPRFRALIRLDDGRFDGDPVLRTAGLELTVVRENRVDRAGIAQLDRGRQMDGIESANLSRLEARGVVQEP